MSARKILQPLHRHAELPRPARPSPRRERTAKKQQTGKLIFVPARCDDVPRLAPDNPGPWIPGGITTHTQVQIYRAAHDASTLGNPSWPHPLSKPHSVCLSFSPSAFRRHDTLLEKHPTRGRASLNQSTQTSPSSHHQTADLLRYSRRIHIQPQCSSQLAQP